MGNLSLTNEEAGNSDFHNVGADVLLLSALSGRANVFFLGCCLPGKRMMALNSLSALVFPFRSAEFLRDKSCVPLFKIVYGGVDSIK